MSTVATAPPSAPPTESIRRRWGADLSSSLVVFLVALPLCVGVAVASGVPAELGIITGIVGGLVAGSLPGSSLQVSGPAAGLTVITLELVTEHGLGSLGVVVLAAGVLQIVFGLIRIGTWFQAISTSVVHGMLAGIGLVLVLGQLYAAGDAKAPGGALENLAGLPGLFADVAGSTAVAAAGIALLTLVTIGVWRRLPLVSRVLPPSLAAILVAIAVTVLFDLPVERLSVGAILDVVQVPSGPQFGDLLNGTLLGTAVVFALIASAESLFSATAVDRMHTGRPTRYNAELVAQGAGNAVCGLLGALPMTAVIVRSVANVESGARTKASRILHGVWLLLFVVAVPQLLGFVPVAALAALLLNAGWKLISPSDLVTQWRTRRGEALVMTVTAVAVVATTLFEGVVIGIVLALAKVAWDLSRLSVDVDHDGAGRARVKLRGSATFLRVPRINSALDEVPDEASVVSVDAGSLEHFDDASREAVLGWARRQEGQGRTVTVHEPDLPHATS